MLVKAFIIVVLLTILGSLGSALVFLIKDKGQGDRTVKALTLRIAISVSLFVLLLILFAMGIITPHGIQP